MAAVIDAEHLGGADVAAAVRIFADASARDGVHPLSEQALLRLRDGNGALLLREGEQLAGFAVRDGDVAEFVVDPAHRGRGHGRALLRALLDGGAGPLSVWAHGDLPAAKALAGEFGLERVRALWTMTRPTSAALPENPIPPGVRVRTFRVGADEDAWTAVNARAFAHHPEQGGWTRADLERREREPWFDPDGFFIAERDGVIVGFHWTKVEDGRGEVYVVGVDPDAQGIGLGRTLTLVGLYHLGDTGVPEVSLYVDESNMPAIALYRGLGFIRSGTDAMYRTTRQTHTLRR